MFCHFCHLILNSDFTNQSKSWRQLCGFSGFWLTFYKFNLQLIPIDVAKTIMLAEKWVRRKIGGNNDNLILRFNFNSRLKNMEKSFQCETLLFDHYLFKIIKKFTFGILFFLCKLVGIWNFIYNTDTIQLISYHFMLLD